MRKLLLFNHQSPGDIVMMTAAVRDLMRAHPGQFQVAVDTPCRALWEHNPNISKFNVSEPGVECMSVEYPLIHRSNQDPWHFIHGMRMDLEAKLKVQIPQGPFKGDIHLADTERSWMSQVHELTGKDTRYWIIVSGGKTDFTAKWWDPARYQKVVDLLKDKVQFVQVGEVTRGHVHPPLAGTIDLRGRTDLRQLIRLVYHSSGVVCPVTALMHLAAAVPVRTDRCMKNRPAVVVAGGREPMQWEAYPHHQYLHTCGKLSCCDNGGCWKSRTVPVGDGDEKDKKSLCLKPVKLDSGVTIPRCLDLISPEEVARHVLEYEENFKK